MDETSSTPSSPAPVIAESSSDEGGGDAATIIAEIAASMAGADGAAAETPAETATETPAVEAKVEEPAKVEEKPPEAAPVPRKDWVAMAKERAKNKATLAAAEAKLAAAKSLEDRIARAAGIESKIKQSPLAAFEELGGNVDLLLEQVVNKGKDPPEPTAGTALEEIAKLKAELAAEKVAASAAAQQRLIDEWQSGLVKHVTAAGEKYDLINSLGMHDAVVETARNYALKHQVMIDHDTAAEYVEKALAAGLSKSKKFVRREDVKTPAPKSETKPPTVPAKTGPRTLGSVPSREVPSSDEDGLPMNDQDRLRAVLRDFQ